MPAGHPMYGKGYYDGSEAGYDKGYDEGSLAGALFGAGVTGVIALGIWAVPKVKAALSARNLKRVEENPPALPAADEPGEEDDATE